MESGLLHFVVKVISSLNLQACRQTYPLENCPECQYLENIRLAKIKHWVHLVHQRDNAGREQRTLTPDFIASIMEAEAAENEAWQRIGEHRRSHKA
jgi:hypothetical protein